MEPKRIMEATLGKLVKLGGFKSWMILMTDEGESRLVLECGGGVRLGRGLGFRMKIDEGLAGRVLKAKAPVLMNPSEARSRGRRLPDVPANSSWSQVLGLPLISRGKVIGIVELVKGPGQQPFRRRDMQILSLLLEPMAAAIENARLLRKSEELSITDDLTKLYNSRFLNSQLQQEVQRCRRYRSQVSLIFLDLDGFKHVHDRHGHLAGSRALVEVGVVIRDMVREIDVVSRFGGDEFTVILPQTGPEGAKTIAERIRQRIEDTVFLEVVGLRVRITASLGIATFPDKADGRDALIQKADQAMYRVKERGKNGIEMAD
jgi:diguanylate cyclase (GGDEF)-like protein